MENTALYKDITLYLDCDGVILDTIDTALKLMKEEKMDTSVSELVNFFFINTDWNVLIYQAGILNNAISKIKKIIEANLFGEVIILTKISGNVDEERIKRILFGKLLPETKIIAVEFSANKDEVVDPINNILVDDTIKNGLRWSDAGGVSVYFAKENSDLENDCIDDLSDIINTKSVKKLMKSYDTRNLN